MTTVSENDPLLGRRNSSTTWCWFVLLSFCCLSFSSALMWDTFSPCLYLFADYYFDGNVTTATINAINAMSLIYMMIYPMAVQPSLRFFEDKKDCPGSGLKRGILIGAFLNALGALIRYLGAAPDRYVVVFIGQTVAAIAQVFMLSIPPRLARTWFRDSQVNFVTSVGVSANQLGVAAGICSPMVVQAATMAQDIPRLLFWQFLLCSLALGLAYTAFSRSPDNDKEADGTELAPIMLSANEQAKILWSHRSFYDLLLSYGIVNGAQCAVVTLIAQILLPSFQGRADENYVGWVGFIMLLAGIPASCVVGLYLDRTFQYRVTCNFLTILSFLSVTGMYLAIELQYLPVVTISCITFGLASSAIIPAVFQYANELYYPIDENIPAGYLCTVSNLGGVLLATIMGWAENSSTTFTMRWPVLGLVAIALVGCVSMARVQGPLKRQNQ
ncbi:major facilitator superfamily domain-containing protein [Fennellomyces sp. T-0311]|nr:major facilitator superfamily domain-containing protein [Fennellomyces sp. T-0311]